MYDRKENITPVNIEEEMKDSYMAYAMSVIVGRALPDVRDGLKPVHRRILYAMKQLGFDHTKPYRKCARITGEVLGKFHPHGDTAVYDSLVRMVQKFSLRYPLVDGQGNFGSVDGDAAAAMRYTEARLAKISQEILLDLDKDTVNFVPNFDGSLQEPEVLPSVLPNLILNGSSGIAVGMATNIPPHNLTEVTDAIIALIENPEITIKDLMHYIKGPDFPTGGLINGLSGIKEAYNTGRGIIRISARAYVETGKKGNKDAIIVTEIPYQVNKSSLISQIVELAQKGKIDGITDLRDESDKEGMRIVIELKRGQNAQVTLNQLYKYSQMQTSFGIIMLALVANRPKILNLKQVLNEYIFHRREVVIRRTKYLLNKAEERAHILEGLKIAISNLDEIIKIIKKADSVQDAQIKLIKRFKLSEIQAQAILQMQLQKLTGLEREKIENEYLDLIKKIQEYTAILESEKKIMAIIKEEILKVKETYGDGRRTDILEATEDFEIEDLIADEDVVLTVTHSGYVKRLPVGSYKRQHRGGVGITGMETKETDYVEHLFIASTHDYMLLFTDMGKVYWIKVHEIPQAGRTAKGKAIVNMVQLSEGENITSLIPIREFKEDNFLVMCTREGKVKKTKLSAFAKPRKDGIIAITLSKTDKHISTVLTEGTDELFLATKKGKSIRFSEKQVRNMGRSAQGVKGMGLGKKDEVIIMEKVNPDGQVLTVTSKGFGKKTDFKKYTLQNRAGKGLININLSSKTGEVVSVISVEENDEILIITKEGMVIRCAVSDVRATSRNTQGVTLVKLKTNDQIGSVSKVVTRSKASDFSEDQEDQENTEENKQQED